jgi:hypothetical protein
MNFSNFKSSIHEIPNRSKYFQINILCLFSYKIHFIYLQWKNFYMYKKESFLFRNNLEFSFCGNFKYNEKYRKKNSLKKLLYLNDSFPSIDNIYSCIILRNINFAISFFHPFFISRVNWKFIEFIKSNTKRDWIKLKISWSRFYPLRHFYRFNFEWDGFLCQSLDANGDTFRFYWLLSIDEKMCA